MGLNGLPVQAMGRGGSIVAEVIFWRNHDTLSLMQYAVAGWPICIVAKRLKSLVSCQLLEIR
jgi:hypothetical protein